MSNNRVEEGAAGATSFYGSCSTKTLRLLYTNKDITMKDKKYEKNEVEIHER
jgi:hypothetical protein